MTHVDTTFKKVSILVGILFIIGCGIYFFTETFFYKKVSSRIWVEYAQNLVREKKPTPPASARFYAYISTVYYDVLLETGSKDQASLATAEMINFFYPDKEASSTEILLTINTTVDQKSIEDRSLVIVEKYKKRHEQDIRQAIMPVRPKGEQYWVEENPFEPSAGSWQRWNTGSTTFKVVPPPLYKSKKYNDAVALVKESASLRTAEQGAKVNFWGGVPGTEAPAGIWQNRLYFVTLDMKLSDKEYAYAQMILAQALADSFMECWKIKYTYWTKRPSMADGTIELAMNNPPFPSYVSGHSTISRTAGEVLSVLFPEYKDTWLSDAEEAKNTRLWAGIHFPYDNEIGADLGREIGEVIIKKLDLKNSKEGL